MTSATAFMAFYKSMAAFTDFFDRRGAFDCEFKI
jgi:hypothetical protein